MPAKKKMYPDNWVTPEKLKADGLNFYFASRTGSYKYDPDTNQFPPEMIAAWVSEFKAAGYRVTTHLIGKEISGEGHFLGYSMMYVFDLVE